LLNNAINVFSFELHILTYQFCDPGMHLEKRLAKDNQSINPLDTACREHDIIYVNNLTANRLEPELEPENWNL